MNFMVDLMKMPLVSELQRDLIGSAKPELEIASISLGNCLEDAVAPFERAGDDHAVKCAQNPISISGENSKCATHRVN